MAWPPNQLPGSISAILGEDQDRRLTDVVGIAVCETDAHILVQKILQVESVIRVDEVSRILELVVNAIVSRVVEGNTKRLLYLWQVEIIGIQASWSRVCGRMTDIISTASRVKVVRRFDVVSAHVGGLVANLQIAWSQFGLGDGSICVVVGSVAFGRGPTEGNLVETAVEHVICKLGVRIDCIVVCLDAVGIVNSELGV